MPLDIVYMNRGAFITSTKRLNLKGTTRWSFMTPRDPKQGVATRSMSSKTSLNVGPRYKT